MAPIPRWERRLDRAILALGRSPWGDSGFGRPRGIMHIFRLVERILERGHPVHQLRQGGILLYEIAPLTARALPLPNGAVVRRGEVCVGLHFDNPTLAALSTGEPNIRRLTWQLTRLCDQDLAMLARRVRQGVIPADIRAIWAETLVYRALGRYGFVTRPAAPTLRTPFARLFMLAILAIYGRPRQLAQGGRSLDHFRLGEAWISIEDLLARFPADPAEVRRWEDEPGAVASR